jgi:hypothetical protein
MKKIKRKRHRILDLIRVLAVFLMLLTHTISYLYIGDSRILWAIRDFGNTVCFTSFLFASGAVSYVAYIDKSKTKYTRIIKFLLFYYLFAILVSLPQIFTDEGLSFKSIIEIIFFIHVPGYTEFIIPFIFFSAVVHFFKKYIKKLAAYGSYGYLLYLIGFIIFGIGEVLWQILPQNPISKTFGSLFYGSNIAGLYRFPIFQYSLVFMIGLHFGHFLTKKKSRKEYFKHIGLNLLLFVALFTVSLLVGSSDSFRRWPPSIGFLSMGVLWIYLQLFALRSFSFIKSLSEGISKKTIFLNKNLLLILLVHTLVLTYYSISSLPKSTDLLSLVALFSLSFAFSIVLVKIFHVLYDNIKGKQLN